MWNHHQRITAPRCNVGRPRSSGVGHFHAVCGGRSIGSRYIDHQHGHCNANSSGAVSQWSGSVQCKCGFRTDQSFRPCHSHCCSFAQPMDARAAYLGAGCVCCNGCSPFQNELMHAGLGLHLLPLAAVSPYLSRYPSPTTFHTSATHIPASEQLMQQGPIIQLKHWEFSRFQRL